MGLLLYPVYDPPANLDSTATGEHLAAHIEAIDAAAKRLELTPLTAFGDSRPIPDGFDGDPEELDAIMGPCADWFASAAGERAVEALADAISARPADFECIADPDIRAAVAEELRELARTLGRASAMGLRFRLELS